MEDAALDGYHVVLQASDVASGLNTKRRGMALAQEAEPPERSSGVRGRGSGVVQLGG